MVLLIDNYDSFVHNLARYFEVLGWPTTVYRNDAIALSDISELNPSCIIISPGPCTPLEAGISVALIQQFYSRFPMLGVCLGHQVIASAFGAAIVRAKKPVHGKSSQISHDGDSIFIDLPNPLTVGRYHSLIVESLPTASELVPLAWSPQAEMMALKHSNFPVFGVQFHPESVLTLQGYALLNNFLKLVK